MEPMSFILEKMRISSLLERAFCTVSVQNIQDDIFKTIRAHIHLELLIYYKTEHFLK